MSLPALERRSPRAGAVLLLREAFMKTMTDREFLEEAKKKNLDITPTPAEELETLAREVVSQPPEVVERMKKLLSK
jgi:hypothetical protein